MTKFASLNIVRYWVPLNSQLIELIDLIPGDKLDWSPKPELYNFRGILIHISSARHTWMTRDIRDGEETPDVLQAGQSRDGLKESLRLSWARMERFLQDAEKLDATYDIMGGAEQRDGHWIAYHGLEHDIHHRADIFHYLALLGIEHGEIQAP
jgi:uncharacterized damage-inducible protein DinB